MSTKARRAASVDDLAAEYAALRAAARAREAEAAAARVAASPAGRRRARWGAGDDVVRPMGKTTPRLWTQPLVTGPAGPCGCGCALTPETSVGFDQARFAAVVLGRPLDGWQRWLVIHAGELRPDGMPRFSTVLVLVSRQNGKTHCLVVLTLYWLFVEGVDMILGTSTKIEYAKESWKKAIKLAEASPALTPLRPPKRWYRETNGEQECWTADGARYKIAASNSEGGRSLTLDRLVADELRQHHDYSAWDAAEPATSAVPDSQVWAITNAGDERSVVLNDLHAAAMAYIERGAGDDDLGLFEWSAPLDADPTDLHALAQANPNLGHRINARKLLSKARRAKRRGGRALTSFRTEYMCQRVPKLNAAIDPAHWAACGPAPGAVAGGLGDVRDRVAMCLDVAPDGLHATLYAAAVMPDTDRVRVDFVREWSGVGCVDQLGAELPDLVATLRPRVLGWFPNGPAAAVAADVADRKQRRAAGRAAWPPRGVKISEVRGEVSAVCMGFAELVRAGRLEHPADPLLDAQVRDAEKLQRSTGGWVFARPLPDSDDDGAGDVDQGDDDGDGEEQPDSGGHVDAVYAAAGAAHLARTMPAPVGRPRLVTVEDDGD